MFFIACMSEGLLRKQIKWNVRSKTLIGSGCKSTLSKQEQYQLTNIIGSMSNLRFSPTTHTIKDYAHNYVAAHDLKTTFKNNRPGKNWLCEFMKRNKLSLKRVNLISAARKSTSHLFLINDLYDLIKEYIEDAGLLPTQVWNADESGRPTDPVKAREIAPKGKVVNKLTYGAGRENITKLAVSSAAGRGLDPLIIFSGVNF